MVGLAVLAAAIVSGAVAAPGVAVTALYIAPGGSDRNPCTQSQPCGTFDHAYQAAAPGQLVMVGGGSYPAQAINRDPRKNGPPNVVFQPAAGASVQAGRLTIAASNLMLQNMQFPWSIRPGASHVTLQQISANGAINIDGASNISVLGGQVYSPSPVTTDSQIASYAGQVPTSIVFDGVSFHDWIDAGPTPGTHHIECLQFGAGINVTIKNSSFQRCETHDIFIRSWATINGNPSPLRNFTIQNNQLGATLAGYYSLRLALQTGWPCQNFLIANNTAMQDMFSDCTAAGIQFLGNSQPSMSAYGCAHLFGTVWIGNTFWSGVPCGNNYVSGSSPPPPSPNPNPGGKTGDGKTGNGQTTDGKSSDSKTGDGATAPTTNNSGEGTGSSKPLQIRGRILTLTPTTITINAGTTTLSCRITTGSPSLTGYTTGQTATLTCTSETSHALTAIAH
jgi:hypothetical protein